MNASDMLDDTFPHGTVEGYTGGCRTNHCPAPMTCTTVRTRYVSDWGFRKMIDGGSTAADIVAADTAAAEAARIEARAARRARDAARAEEKARAERNRNPQAPRPMLVNGKDDHGRTRKTRITRTPFTAAEIRLLKARHAEGVSDVKIGRELGRNTGSVWAKRTELGLPAHRAELVHGTVRGYNRGCRGADCPKTPTCQQAMSDYKRGRRAAA